jgi:hypothetical protein
VVQLVVGQNITAKAKERRFGAKERRFGAKERRFGAKERRFGAKERRFGAKERNRFQTRAKKGLFQRAPAVPSTLEHLAVSLLISTDY